ncbi:MAG: hypothetical protein ACI90V_002872, partial [Bacillariaceae sp.]|jgi:hypothetical protein
VFWSYCISNISARLHEESHIGEPAKEFMLSFHWLKCETDVNKEGSDVSTHVFT